MINLVIGKSVDAGPTNIMFINITFYHGDDDIHTSDMYIFEPTVSGKCLSHNINATLGELIEALSGYSYSREYVDKNEVLHNLWEDEWGDNIWPSDKVFGLGDLPAGLDSFEVFYVDENGKMFHVDYEIKGDND